MDTTDYDNSDTDNAGSLGYLHQEDQLVQMCGKRALVSATRRFRRSCLHSAQDEAAKSASTCSICENGRRRRTFPTRWFAIRCHPNL
jgi:hypothetical protein